MSDLKLIEKRVCGKIRIKENSQYNNVDAKKVILAKNTMARVYGRVEDIVLKKGSLLYFHGTISGSVKNEGGEIRLFK